MIITLESQSTLTHEKYFIGNRSRLATATSAKIVNHETIVCASFVGRKLHLVKFNLEDDVFFIQNSIETVFAHQSVETDLCATSPTGRDIVTSNFYLGTLTHYRHRGDKLEYVRDLAPKINGFVHGVKFLNDRIVAATACSAPFGVHFFDFESGEGRLHVPLAQKTQDIAFVSERRMIVTCTKGAPKAGPQPLYDSEVQIIEFDLSTGMHSLGKSSVIFDAHLDSSILFQDEFYVTDQANNRVLVLDIDTLETRREISGYDFPHGIDINLGLIAVTNYGNNTIDIRRI
jgi:hypothetical protein